MNIIRVYNYRSDTREYIGESDYLPDPSGGTGEFCTEIAPPDKKAGFVCIFDERQNRWTQVEDHRGITVYDTLTARPFFIGEPGSIPDGMTTVVPDVDFPKWNGTGWITDEQAKKEAAVEAAENHKSALVAEANRNTSLWQTQLILGIITDEDRAALTEWMQYIQKVRAADTSAAPDILWPERPVMQATFPGRHQ